METSLIDLSTFHDLAKADIGAFSPKPTSIEGDQLEAARSFFQSPDGSVDIGIWECTPGRFTADRTNSSEICHIISGRVEVSRADGEMREMYPRNSVPVVASLVTVNVSPSFILWSETSGTPNAALT